MPKIEVDHMGPVVEFEYDMSEPGLHVLKGSHGAGKTTILRTVQLAAGEKPEVKPSKSDGSKRGEAIIAGKTLKISRTTREEGELEVEGMGDLNLSTLHNPGHKTATIRDKYRIATLVRLAGGVASVDQFKALLPDDEWEKVIDEALLPDDADPVELAAKIKRQIDQAAKGLEGFAAGVDAKVELLRSTGDNLIAEVIAAGGKPGEADTLDERKAAHEAAIAERQRLANQQRDAERCEESAKQARERIAQARAEYDGPTSEAAEIAAGQAAQRLRDTNNAIAAMESDLAKLREQNAKNDAEASRTAAEFKAALQHEETLTKWEEQLQADAVAPVDPEAMKDAEDAVDAAVVAIRMCDAEAEAARRQKEADELAAKAKAATKRGEKLREAAAATSRVLSEAIATIPDCPLFVETDDDGETRLVIQTDRSTDKPEPFDELSDGERWKVIVPLCCGAGRLVVLPQAAYGELAPSTRAMLDALAAERGAYILTAQCDDGELRGERYAAE